MLTVFLNSVTFAMSKGKRGYIVILNNDRLKEIEFKCKSSSGARIMYYKQPSFKETHKATEIITNTPSGKSKGYDYGYYPSIFYSR